MVNARRNGPSTHARRVVPIIFVPGVMGTRLHFTRINEYWDPDSAWRMMHWLRISAGRARREMHFSRPAEVMRENRSLTPEQRRRGWAGMVSDFYIPYLRHLAASRFRCAAGSVYAVGYDWRQTNRDSGRHLNREINRILREEGAEEYILVSHSMGGLVTRSCLKDHATNARRLLGIIHVAQPVRGAPVFYRRMYTGARRREDGGILMSWLIGNTPAKFATLLSGLRGPCELIPNDFYRDGAADWLWGPPTRRGPAAPWTGKMFEHYRSRDAPPGIAWSLTGVPARQLRTRMEQAEEFHDWLQEYRHDRTWAVFSTGLETDVRVSFDGPAPRDIRMGRRDEGDATVPSASGGALFDSAATTTDATGAVFLRNRNVRQFRTSGVEHAAIFNDDAVRTVVGKQIVVALGCVRPPAAATVAQYRLAVEYGDFEALLDPPDDVRGRQQRLQAMDWYAGAIDGDDGPKTRRAWRHFREQVEHDLGHPPSDDELLDELKARSRAILRPDDGTRTAQTEVTADARFVLPGSFCFTRDNQLGNPLSRHRYNAEQAFFDRNPALGRIPFVARVTDAATGAPAAGVRVLFELVPAFDPAEDQKDYLTGISGRSESARSPRAFVRSRLPSVDPPYGFNCPTAKGGRTPGDAAGELLGISAVTGFPWTPVRAGRPNAWSVVGETDADGRTGVLFTPARQAGDAYRLRMTVMPAGRAATAEETVRTGRIQIWRALRIARVVQKNPQGAFAGAPPVSAGMTGPLGRIRMPTIRDEVAKAFMILEVDHRAARPLVMSARGYRGAIEFAIRGAANPQGYDLHTLVKTDRASPFLIWLEDDSVYNRNRAPGSTALNLAVAATWNHLNNLITSLTERFLRYWGGSAVPGLVIIRSEIGDSYSYWNHPSKPVYNDGSAWCATTSGVAMRYRGCYVWYPLSVYNNGMPYGVTQNTMHEAGHVLYLRHHYTGGGPGTEAGGFPANHDGRDYCLMGYLALTTNDFCGKCLLKLRGWDETKV